MQKNKIKLQPYHKKGRFYNSHNDLNGSLFSDYAYLIRSFIHEVTIFIVSLKNGESRLPKNIKNWFMPSKVIASSVEPSITWIGHASFLIQIGGVNILTDPIFGSATVLYQRILPPGIQINDLPKIDYVIISHNHLDHMDKNSLLSLKKLFPDIKILVPFGDKNWFEKRKISNVSQYMWWEQSEFKLDHSSSNLIKFTFLPSYHWSQRGLFDQNKSLWGSWMIQANDQTIYFAGDTAYSDHFAQIAKEFPVIDIALMPIGPCEPRQKMCHSHIDSNESGKSFIDLGATHFIPMHWGTFHFGTDSFDTPITRLLSWWQTNLNQLSFKKLHILKFGERLSFSYQDMQPSIQKTTSLDTLNN